jgi:hypothetical protein
MPLRMRRKVTVQTVKVTSPKRRLQAGNEQGQLTLAAPESALTMESHRATSEEIDQAFTEQLAASPQSTFLREVVADRARRRCSSFDFGC